MDVSLVLSGGIGLLVDSAPLWVPVLREKVVGAGVDVVLKKGQERGRDFLDEKKHL